MEGGERRSSPLTPALSPTAKYCQISLQSVGERETLLHASHADLHDTLVAYVQSSRSAVPRTLTVETAGNTGIMSLGGSALGTSYSLRWAPRANAASAGRSAEEVGAQVTQVLAEIDEQMSLWREDSELSRFNRSTSTDWFEVSDATAEVVAAALDISRTSAGAFDPTVAPLVQVWSFGPGGESHHAPTSDALAQAREAVGYKLVEVRRSPPALRKQKADVTLDLNAIAKGYAVDRVANVLAGLDPLGSMVEIGGEVRVAGTKRDGSRWRIGIERPIVGRREVESFIELSDVALATSGDYRNYFEEGGKRYSHTIDPRTGRPIEHTLASVSVLADDCMTADGWATALMVLGPAEGPALARRQNLRALFLVRRPEGFASIATPGFPEVQALAQVDGGATPLTTFVLTAILFGLAIVGMALGVILSNRRLRGSCGGLAGLKDEEGRPFCEACTHPAEECTEFKKQGETRAERQEPRDSQS